MIVFIDYSNVEEIPKQKGAKFIVDRVLNLVGGRSLQPKERVLARLYDGWYEGSSPTPRWHTVSAEVQKSFPCPVTVPDDKSTVTVIVQAELAVSLCVDPQKHLFHTYRRRRYTSSLRCENPPSIGCSDAQCPMTQVSKILNSGYCPNCGRRMKEFLYCNEQKLVDTMLTVDIMHSVQAGEKNIVVVSSDDDLWPAVRSAIALGAQVTHVHPRKPGQVEAYAAGFGPEYRPVKW